MTRSSEELGWALIVLGIVLTLFSPFVEVFVHGFERRANKARDAGAAGAPTESFAPTSSIARSEAWKDDELDVQTWAVSKERDKYLDGRARAYTRAVGGGSILLGGFVWLAGRIDSRTTQDANLWRTVAIGAVIVGVAVVCYSMVPYAAARSAYRQRRLATAAAKVDAALKQACSGTGALKIQELFELNRRQLDEYQLLTRKQQRSAFMLAQAASVVAFVVLVGGVVIALGQTHPIDKYVTGALSALGSLLSGFLAATFFASHRDADKQMNLYYLEPQRTGRLLALERVSTLTPPLDATILAEVVKAVLTWEMPADAPVTDKPTDPPPPQDGTAAQNGKPAGATSTPKDAPQPTG